jgi:hypothetical protein
MSIACTPGAARGISCNKRRFHLLELKQDYNVWERFWSRLNYDQCLA